jgi:hypothetical protein
MQTFQDIDGLNSIAGRLIPECTSPIRFGKMMDAYREVFAAFKRQGRALPASNWSIQNENVFKWVKLRVSGK